MVSRSRREVLVAFAGVASLGCMSRQVWGDKPVLESGSQAKPTDLIYFADGKHDATQAIQSYIDAAAVKRAVVNIPAGEYMVNPDVGISLHSGSRFELADGARLVAKPSHNSNYGVIRIYNVNDVVLGGGAIVGERDHHLGSGGEWGMGIDVRGSSNVVIHDISVSKCWGDGIYLGRGVKQSVPCKGIIIRNVTSVGNRRQGLSIVSCIGALVENSRFLNTSGTAPSAGIDLEPNKNDPVENIVIRNCIMQGNTGAGIQVVNNTAHVTVKNCEITANRDFGIFLGGVVKAVSITANKFTDNGIHDIYVARTVKNYELKNNIYSQTGISRVLPLSQQVYVEH